jgi:hypothetical protein
MFLLLKPFLTQHDTLGEFGMVPLQTAQRVGGRGFTSSLHRGGVARPPTWKVFLRTWVHRMAYRVALARGEHRVNLDGSDAGPAFGEIRDGEAIKGDEPT